MLLSRLRLTRLTVAAVMLGAVGCASDAPPSEAAVHDTPAPKSSLRPGTAVTDDLGREVHLPDSIGTVLPLAPNLTELVAASGGLARLAGSSQADDYPPGVKALPRFSSYPFSAESVVALAPDLVLANAAINTEQQAARLEELGVPTYFFRFDEVADIPRALTRLSHLFLTDRGAHSAERFEKRVRDVLAAVRGARPVRTLLLVGTGADLHAYGRDATASEAIRLAGGANLTDSFEGDRAMLSEEFVLEQAPEVIVIAGDGDARTQLLTAHPVFASVPAVAENRVLTVNPDHMLRPGPRLADAIARIARFLHPDLFASGAA